MTLFQIQLETVLNEIDFIRSSHPEVFLGKFVLKICMQQILYTGEHPRQNVIY